MIDEFDKTDETDGTDDIYFEKIDIGGMKRDAFAVKMETNDGRYIVHVLSVEQSVNLISKLWGATTPNEELLRRLRSRPYMFFEDIMHALGAGIYSVRVDAVNDDGELDYSVTIYLPDDRLASVEMEPHQALGLAVENGIPIAVSENALEQSDHYLHQLPRWYDINLPYTRVVLHSTATEQLATLPQSELEFMLNRVEEMEDYESAAMLNKALSYKNQDGKSQDNSKNQEPG